MNKKQKAIEEMMKKGMTREQAEKTADEIFKEEDNTLRTVIKIVRYLLGGFIILYGLACLLAGYGYFSFQFAIAAGILIFPILWENCFNKYLDAYISDKDLKMVVPIVVPIVLLIFSYGFGKSTIKKHQSKTEKTEYTTEYEEKTTRTYTTTERTTTTTETTTETTTALNFDCSWGIERYNTNEYKYITESDFAKYYPNLANVKIALVGEVDRVDGNKLYLSTENRGFMFTVCNMLADYSAYSDGLHDKQCLIIGTVSTTTSYSFMGDSVQMNDCLIVAYDNDVLKYKKDSSDSSLNQYFKVTEDVANSSSTEISESEYKNLCSTLSYNDILRNPSSFKNKYCKVSGKVDQIIEGIFNTVTIYVEDGNGNKWECTYCYDSSETRVLEGDYVTFYGKCNGTTNATTLLNKQVTLPYVSVEYLR
jgi:hypothetical protein